MWPPCSCLRGGIMSILRACVPQVNEKSRRPCSVVCGEGLLPAPAEPPSSERRADSCRRFAPPPSVREASVHVPPAARVRRAAPVARCDPSKGTNAVRERQNGTKSPRERQKWGEAPAAQVRRAAPVARRDPCKEANAARERQNRTKSFRRVAAGRASCRCRPAPAAPDGCRIRGSCRGA